MIPSFMRDPVVSGIQSFYYYSYYLAERPVLWARAAGDYVHLLAESVTHRYEDEKLREVVSGLRNKLVTLEHENSELRQMLHLVSPDPTVEYQRAAVFGHHTAASMENVFIHAGYAQGVNGGDLLLSDGLLFGIVTTCGQNFARVKTIYSSKLSVPAYCPEGAYECIIAGTGQPNHLLVKYAQNLEIMRPGQKIFTSGTGGVYPRDIFVGYVATSRAGALVVKTTIPFQQTRYVDIIHPVNKEVESSLDEG